MDLHEEAAKYLPNWLDALESAEICNRQLAATSAYYFPKMLDLVRSNALPSAKFAILHKFSIESAPIADKFLKSAQTYSRETISLDPIVTKILDLTELAPAEYLPIVQDVLDSIMVADPGLDEDYDAPKQQFADLIKQYGNTSRSLRELGVVIGRAVALAEEADQIVYAWRERAGAITLQGDSASGVNLA